MSALPAASAAAAAAGGAPAPAKVIRVGNYKLGKTLGIGSFCKVKLATHEPTGAKVAIKILNRKKLKKQDMGDKVRTEIHILRQFSHPHIIRLYEVIDASSDIFQVLEYAPNGELFDYIVSRGKLDEGEARTLFQQIVSGIEYCIAEGSRVNLASGVSVPIEQLAAPEFAGALVLARGDDGSDVDDAPTGAGGLVPRELHRLLVRGVKACVELLFSDGRTLTCTSDHRILTADGDWVTAGQLKLGASHVAVGVEFPLHDLTEDALQRPGWEMTLPALGCTLDMQSGRERALAFARLLGLVCTEAASVTLDSRGSPQAVVSLACQLDAGALQRDVLLLTGVAPEISRDGLNGAVFRVALPAALTQSMLDAGLTLSPSPCPSPCPSDPSRANDAIIALPSFLTEPTAPRSLVREFLGGLFGGAGAAPMLDHQSDPAQARLTDVGLAVRCGPMALDQLLSLLARCGLDSSALTLRSQAAAAAAPLLSTHTVPSPVATHTAPTHNATALPLTPAEPSSSLLSIPASLLLSFHESVGFRYSSDKQLRLTGAAMFHRARATVLRQCGEVRTAALELLQRDAAPGMTVPAAVAAAKAQLARAQLLHPDVLDWAPADLRSLDSACPALDLDRALDSFDIRKLFLSSPPSSSSSTHPAAGASLSPAKFAPLPDLEHSGPIPLPDPSLPRAQSASECNSDSDSLPLFRSLLVGRRDAGGRRVYDLSVPSRAERFDSFTANAIPVHNCHVHGVVHRDLKPENLLIDSENRIKIADFGLSNRMKDGQFLKTSCGSPNYAAPEVISGNLYAGAEVDVWSCGVILYALLCGSLPFDDENIRALFRKIKGGIYSIPSHVSPGARDLLSKMLVVDPLKRASIPQVMQHSWYRQHLPLYLSLSAEQQIAQTQALDEAVVAKVVAMGFTRERLLKSLSVGHELLTSRKYANQTEARRMAVIYNLLRDNKRRKEQNLDECVDATAGRPKDSANNVADLSEDTTGMSPFAAATTKLLVQQHLQHQHDVRMAAANPHLPSSLPLLGGRWQLGMSSNLDAQSIMNEVYRILRKFNFEWKVLSLYKLKARYPAGLVDRSGKPVSSAEVCKIGIQLYKVGGRDTGVGMPGASAASSAATTPTQSPALGPISPTSAASSGSGSLAPSPEPQGAFVIDMQKLAGQMFLALELTSAIIAMASHIHPNAHLLPGNSHM